MGATSTEGVGQGSVTQVSTSELSKITNALPTIFFTGYVTLTESVSSPPAELAAVEFPYPLIGGADNYVVLVTTLNGGSAYVVNRTEDENGYFTGFSAISDAECEAMYLVARVGSKPQ